MEIWITLIVGALQIITEFVCMFWGVHLNRRETPKVDDSKVALPMDSLSNGPPPFLARVSFLSIVMAFVFLFVTAYSGYRLQADLTAKNIMQFVGSSMITVINLTLFVAAELKIQDCKKAQYIRRLFLLNSAEIFILNELVKSKELSEGNKELLQSLVNNAMEASRVNDYKSWIEYKFL